ncbi:MAG: bifunctional hydroxymethylpyrimidine kinase/phosphomethylpyrimidine kinase [Acidimicrobiales bacterium]
MNRSRAVALTIAGSDSGGGAGIVADLKTFEALGVWGTVALAAVTAQNTLGVQAVGSVDADLVVAQITSVVADIGVDALKTGMLGSAEIVGAVAGALPPRPLVVDPVLVSSSGSVLLGAGGIDALRELLLPCATLVTPNLAEASLLVGAEVADRDSMVGAARRLVAMGSAAVLVTGGHLPGDVAADCLMVGQGEPVWLESPAIHTESLHGTGCVLSAAICALLAKGASVDDACRRGKMFVTAAIRAGVALGGGPGPVDPGWASGQLSWRA